MPRHPPCALDNLTNTHIKKSRHKHATETKDARVHCTILNDHTNRAHPSHTGDGRTTIAPRDEHTTTPANGDQVVLSGPNSVPPTHTPHQGGHGPDCPVFPLFSSNPLPPPHQANLDTERY